MEKEGIRSVSITLNNMDRERRSLNEVMPLGMTMPPSKAIDDPTAGVRNTSQVVSLGSPGDAKPIKTVTAAFLQLKTPSALDTGLGGFLLDLAQKYPS